MKSEFVGTPNKNIRLTHISKDMSCLEKKCAQILTTFFMVSHTPAHDHCVPGLKTVNMQASDWLLKFFCHYESGF